MRPTGLADLGVSVFPKGRIPKTGESLGVMRNRYRHVRRQRARNRRRKDRLIRLLVRNGLLPECRDQRTALNALDPYDLRKRGLQERLTPHEFGRLLIHLNQRRGHRSSRKLKAESDGPVRQAALKLENALEQQGCRTLGEWFAENHSAVQPVRIRPLNESRRLTYDVYPTREMYEEEFDLLWRTQSLRWQKEGNDVLDEKLGSEIREILFSQRPLREQLPGFCRWEPGERRLPLAHPLAEDYRLRQELHNLYVLEPDGRRPLSVDEVDLLHKRLLRHERLSFDDVRDLIGSSFPFNLESSRKRYLLGHRIHSPMSADEAFGSRWLTFSLETQEQIIALLLKEDDEDALVDQLVEIADIGQERAKAISNLDLPSGYSAFSRKALVKIVNAMKQRRPSGKGYQRYLRADEALLKAGYKADSLRHRESMLEELPYYGEILSHHLSTGSGDAQDPPEVRFGKLDNPSVHLALNQLRKLVNRLVRRFGHPDQIVIELARTPVRGTKAYEEYVAQQNLNEALNKEITRQIRKAGYKPTPQAIRKARLWRELNPSDSENRLCPYTGKEITFEMALESETHIDHIIPRSLSLDNSLSNLLLCTREANSLKAGRTPYEAFGHTPQWQEIVSRSRHLPASKRKRILGSADKGFLKEMAPASRMLNDTRYISMLAREYLTCICRDPKQVWTTRGHLTAWLRKEWGLEGLLGSQGKNREDHRSHAIDAFVIGMTDRHLVARLSKVSRILEVSDEAATPKALIPFPNYRKHIKQKVARLIVHHKPDHGITGEITGSTIYGRLKAHPEVAEGATATLRYPLSEIRWEDIPRIVDAGLREAIQDHLNQALAGKDPASREGKEALKRALDSFPLMDTRWKGLRRIKLFETRNVIEVGKGASRRLVTLGKYHCLEVWQRPDGEWECFFISNLEASQGISPPRHPASRRLMRLHKDDLVSIKDRKGKRQVMRIQKLEKSSNRLVMVPHYSAVGSQEALRLTVNKLRRHCIDKPSSS